MTDIEYLQKYLDKSNLENGIKRLENREPKNENWKKSKTNKKNPKHPRNTCRIAI